MVGGGNSAGQAALYLSRFAERVTIVIRGEGLAGTMSHYLTDTIAAAPNVELRTGTEVVGAAGDGRLARADPARRSARGRPRPFPPTACS